VLQSVGEGASLYNHPHVSRVTVSCVFRPSSRRVPADPFVVLGLDADADVTAIHDARRALAKVRHPDAGGSEEAMQELNAAVDAALAAVASQSGASGASSTPRRSRRPSAAPRGGVRHDHPSFTIEALPAEAFEGLLIAAAELGDLIDDDPPYLLEVSMATPPAWCRLEIVPDAGASTVSITTARAPGSPTPDVDEVRDVWVDALNRLDWRDPGAPSTP
jgi:hypothetical protein